MCVYKSDDGICKKYSTDGVTSYCIDGPCTEEVLTNADKIRSMTDEELVRHIWNKFGCPDGRNYITCGCLGSCKDCWLDWLKQPEKAELEVIEMFNRREGKDNG